MHASRVVGLAAGAFIGGVSAAAAYGSVSRSSQMFGPSVYRGPGRRKTIALTFDDGPSDGTMELLEVLEREDVKATFFQCGMNVARLPHVAGDVAAAGHQIGNHTYSHPRLPFKSREFIEREFTETQKIIQFETGVTPMVLRAPYGFKWLGMRNLQIKLSLLGVMWTVMGYDWRLPAKAIANHVIRNASRGGIVCLHDGRTIQQKPDIQPMLSAVREIIPALRDQGYEFETVADVLAE